MHPSPSGLGGLWGAAVVGGALAGQAGEDQAEPLGAGEAAGLSDVLMDMAPGKGRKAKALKMKVKRVGDAEYLFIEVGGFTFYEDRKTYKQPRTWQSPWLVMKRAKK